MFFCKDCDGLRVQDQHIAILGWNNDAVEYALGLLYYSPCIYICTNGHEPDWDPQHASWLAEYKIPVFHDRISDVGHHDGTVHSLQLAGGDKIAVQAIFTTRGDIFYNQLGKQLGVELDEEGQIKVDHKCRTSVPGLYAAGCVTPANCQMIIAAGQGATAAQAINRDLFEESLEKHKLRLMRNQQLDRRETEPAVLSDSDKP
jgi:thioredoxin reductase (NADPH)